MRRLLLLAFLVFAWSRANADTPDGPAQASGLSAADRKLVLDLTEDALKSKDLWQGKIFLTRVEVFRDSRDAASPWNVQLIHYRYKGDLAIFTSINLGRRQVTKVEAVAHCPTSLAPEELARAEKLARENAQVKKALARFGPPEKFPIDALVVHTVDEKSPNYHHRVVRMFFREGRTYLLYGPLVEVDLTSESVRVVVSEQMHK